MTRHVLYIYFFLETVMVPSRDLVPYANSILCILVPLISHRPDRNTRALDLKGAGPQNPSAPPPSPPCARHRVCVYAYIHSLATLLGTPR